MLVLLIKNTDLGNGYLVPASQFDEIEGDIELELLDCGTSYCGYASKDIGPFLDSVRDLKLGDSVSMGHWTVTCGTMTEEEFENLDEFLGW